MNGRSRTAAALAIEIGRYDEAGNSQPARFTEAVGC